MLQRILRLNGTRVAGYSSSAERNLEHVLCSVRSNDRSFDLDHVRADVSQHICAGSYLVQRDANLDGASHGCGHGCCDARLYVEYVRERYREIPIQNKAGSPLWVFASVRADINPVQDHGFMYTRDLADSDGHAWERCGWICPRFLRTIRPTDRGNRSGRHSVPAVRGDTLRLAGQ